MNFNLVKNPYYIPFYKNKFKKINNTSLIIIWKSIDMHSLCSTPFFIGNFFSQIRSKKLPNLFGQMQTESCLSAKSAGENFRNFG